MNTNFLNKLILFLSVIVIVSCKSTSSVTDAAPTRNSKKSLQKPYVILISLDGFRWDYVERFKPVNMRNFIKNGVKSESLIPSFPSKTFPNHYSIATGMYPDNHGIVGNYFYSHEKKETYKIGNRKTVEDGAFYKGTPIWVQADKANMVTASYFFVGSEADVQGIHPRYYYKYDGSVKNEERVDQALKWLALPEKERPHMITMYFSDMDDIGHKFGPNSDERLKATLLDLDKNLGDLFKGVAESGLPVNIIIVSDHGMAEISKSNYLPIDALKNDSLYRTVDNGAIVNIHPNKGVGSKEIFNYLKAKEDNFTVYLTENAPGFEYTPKNKDWGSIQVLPDIGYYFSSKAGIAAKMLSANTLFGVHGYDTNDKDMHGIFYANGPSFKRSITIKSLKNIHIYPLMCTILGLEIPDNIDGDLKQIEHVLQKD